MPASKKTSLKASVIIPTYNAEKYLGNLLNILKRQTADIQEIIVIDSESADRTKKMVEKFKVKFLSVPKATFDHGGTRTLAAKMAKGEVIVFLTQDVLPYDDRAVEAILKPFESDPKIAAAYGRQVPYPDANPFAAHSRYFGYPDRSFIRVLEDKKRYGIKTAFLSNAFAAYRKKNLEKIGWFKSNLVSTEDTYAGAKMLLAGYRLAYTSSARVYHSHNYTVWQEFKRYFDIGSFHKNEGWIIREFGKADGEGFKYVLSELAYLLKKGKLLKLPEFFLRNFMKFAGYRLGYHHQKLPKKLIVSLSMHPGWWIKNLGISWKPKNAKSTKLAKTKIEK